MAVRQLVVGFGWSVEGIERRNDARKNKLCAFCDKPFRYPWRFYCSHECSDKFFEKYYNIGLSWNSTREDALKRDGYKCVKCGNTGSLEVDHIKEIALGGDEFDINNTQTLCVPCHRKKTARFLKIKKFLLRAKGNALLENFLSSLAEDFRH